MTRGFPSKIHPALLEELIKRREQGRTLGQLRLYALRQGVDVSENAISWQLLKAGADSPRDRWYPSTAKPGRTVKRGSSIVRNYTPEEDVELLRLDAEGLSNYKIGQRMGRSTSSISGRKFTLARRAARAEEE